MTATSPPSGISLADMKALVGTEVGVSRWFSVSQDRIDAFADVTEDHQFIHVDPIRARDEAGMDSTIAHGFLTLSLLSAMALDATPAIEGTRMGINYGFDKIRFLSPVKVGAKVRGRFTLASVSEKKPGEVDVVWQVSVDIEGGKRPALTAEWINRMYLAAEETVPEEKGS
ncbi:nodulation protein N [Roseibium sp. TrichSKD4]|uniref:MaoC family dehydratase n=1 Tax=Roseibium sp. TrichSKD4 TaxID=744980 RepID=UPI0001E567A5|nr:MaoC family dehydratase [Roseibium sp. TrichSKD4]EFO31227.1 nodulation protein N [Roseibium sp. TrichSKD4]